ACVAALAAHVDPVGRTKRPVDLHHGLVHLPEEPLHPAAPFEIGLHALSSLVWRRRACPRNVSRSASRFNGVHRMDGMRAAPAGDHDYERRGRNYATVRQPDPRIEAQIHAALGDARTMVNVGAGAGSYEPRDRHLIAIEPSASMRAQRGPDRVPAIDAVAEHLPLDDASVDAALACV